MTPQSTKPHRWYNNPILWLVVFLIFLLTLGMVTESNCQNTQTIDITPQASYKPIYGQYSDTLIKCTVLQILTRTGHIKTLYHTKYFVMRKWQDKKGIWRKTFYFPNMVTQFTLVWWSNTPMNYPSPNPNDYEIIGDLKTQ